LGRWVSGGIDRQEVATLGCFKEVAPPVGVV
jgi:hypothetical protein